MDAKQFPSISDSVTMFLSEEKPESENAAVDNDSNSDLNKMEMKQHILLKVGLEKLIYVLKEMF